MHRQLALQAFGGALTGAPQRAQLRYTDWTGETATCSVTLTPLSEEAGKITGSICIVRDISEEVRITEQLVQQEDEVQQVQVLQGMS